MRSSHRSCVDLRATSTAAAAASVGGAPAGPPPRWAGSGHRPVRRRGEANGKLDRLGTQNKVPAICAGLDLN